MDNDDDDDDDYDDDDDDIAINRAWRSTRENINTSATESLRYYEFKQHKP